MKKIIITFGLLAGITMAVLGFLLSHLCANDILSYERSELLGYTTMVIALSMIFFGIKSYRDNYGKGSITFWKGVQIGLLITLITSVFYFAGAKAYQTYNPAFVDAVLAKYTEKMVGEMQQQGASQEEIDKTRKQITDMIKLMDNPFFFYVICLVEMAPVGIIITIISAAILRKKEVLPYVPPSDVAAA